MDYLGGLSFDLRLPQAKPSGVLESVLYRMGYVSREYLSERERIMLSAFNDHVRDTVVRDRKAVVLKLEKDRHAIGMALLSRIAMLEEENRRLRCEKAIKD